MSRTYRRKNEEVPDWVFLDYKYIPGSWTIQKIPCENPEKELAKWKADKGGYSSRGPKWFNRLYHTVPRRQQERLCKFKVMQLFDYENSPEFPLSNKPVEYWD